MKHPTRNEIMTVPNAISAAGFSMVVAGSIAKGPRRSTALIGAGRALDLVDGTVARKLGQESDFGADVDATLDKLGIGVITVSAAAKGQFPLPAAAAIAAHNTLNSAASIAHEIRHPDESVRPTKLGKVGLFLENAGMISYLAASAAETYAPESRAARNLKLAGHALVASGAGLGIGAGIGYVARAAKQETL